MNNFFYLLKESMCVVEWPGSCLTIVSFVWKEPHMSRLSASFHAWSSKLVCLFMFCKKKVGWKFVVFGFVSMLLSPCKFLYGKVLYCMTLCCCNVFQFCVFVINYTKKVKSPGQTIKKKLFHSKIKKWLAQKKNYFNFLKESVCGWVQGIMFNQCVFCLKRTTYVSLECLFSCLTKWIALFPYLSKKKMVGLKFVLFRFCFNVAFTLMKKMISSTRGRKPYSQLVQEKKNDLVQEKFFQHRSHGDAQAHRRDHVLEKFFLHLVIFPFPALVAKLIFPLLHRF